MVNLFEAGTIFLHLEVNRNKELILSLGVFVFWDFFFLHFSLSLIISLKHSKSNFQKETR